MQVGSGEINLQREIKQTEHYIFFWLKIVNTHTIIVMQVDVTPLLFIMSQYTYKQSQSSSMYLRDFISFPHCHEVESFDKRGRRQHTRMSVNHQTVATTVYSTPQAQWGAYAARQRSGRCWTCTSGSMYLLRHWEISKEMVHLTYAVECLRTTVLNMRQWMRCALQWSSFWIIPFLVKNAKIGWLTIMLRIRHLPSMLWS